MTEKNFRRMNSPTPTSVTDVEKEPVQEDPHGVIYLRYKKDLIRIGTWWYKYSMYITTKFNTKLYKYLRMYD